MYLLIFDLRGGNTASRRRVNRYLARVARMVQQSVWEFDDFPAVEGAVKVISGEGGKAIVFKRSDAVIS
jgi:hypothetical protein